MHSLFHTCTPVSILYRKKSNTEKYESSGNMENLQGWVLSKSAEKHDARSHGKHWSENIKSGLIPYKIDSKLYSTGMQNSSCLYIYILPTLVQ